jgi:hypothetical protein
VPIDEGCKWASSWCLLTGTIMVFCTWYPCYVADGASRVPYDEGCQWASGAVLLVPPHRHHQVVLHLISMLCCRWCTPCAQWWRVQVVKRCSPTGAPSQAPSSSSAPDIHVMLQVVHPVCPMMKGASGLAVQSYWCPLTGTCEEFCYSSLQMQPDQWAILFHF